MTAGRPSKSIAQKLADGTFRADRANLNEPQPSAFDPTNPFSEETQIYAYKKWEELVPELTERYGIGKGERIAVEVICRFYQKALYYEDLLEQADVQDFEQWVQKKDEVAELEKLASYFWIECVKKCSLMGLDPINRRRVRGPKTGPLGIASGTGVIGLAERGRDRELGPDDELPPRTTGDDLVDSLS